MTPTLAILTLGLDPTKLADSESVTAAFRSLSKIHHPDQEGGDADKFKPLVEARDVLVEHLKIPGAEARRRAKFLETLKDRANQHRSTEDPKPETPQDAFQELNRVFAEICFALGNIANIVGEEAKTSPGGPPAGCCGCAVWVLIIFLFFKSCT